MIRVVFCVDCEIETRQVRYASVNGDRPAHELWRCQACGRILLTLGDLDRRVGLVTDAEQLAAQAAAKLLRQIEGRGRHDFDDAYAHALEHVWKAYRDWRPEQSPSFLAFATIRVQQRLFDWIRRDTPEQFLYAPSLDYRSGDDGDGGAYEGEWAADGDPIRQPLGSGVGDDRDHSLADLRRALVRRDRRRARDQRSPGLDQDADAAPRDPRTDRVEA